MHLKQLAVARYNEVAAKEYQSIHFAEAAVDAFESFGPTKQICETITALAVQHKLMVPTEEAGSSLRAVAKGRPDMLMAIVGEMQAVLSQTDDVRKPGERRFKCSACHQTSIGAIPDRFMFCFFCGYRQRAEEWQMVE